MYVYSRYNKLKHVVAAALYAAILLTEAGEFFVSNSHELFPENELQSQYEREIPEHIPEKYENSVLKSLKTGKQKTTFTSKGDHSAAVFRFSLSFLEGGSSGDQSEKNHKFIG